MVSEKSKRLKAALIAVAVFALTSCEYGPDVYRWEQKADNGKKYVKEIPENEIIYSQDTNYNIKFIRQKNQLVMFIECPTGGYTLIKQSGDNLTGYHSDNYKEVYNDFIKNLK